MYMVSFKHILKVLSHKKLLEAFISVVLIATAGIVFLLFSLNESKTKIAALSTDNENITKAYEDRKSVV